MHKCVAKFTKEAKNVAVSEIAKKIISLIRFIIEIKIKQEIVNFHYDNQSMLHVAENTMI